MTLPRSAAEVLSEHVTLEVECIDRMYLNLYVPQLQRELGVVGFFRARGFQFASGALMEPITRGFVAAMLRFVDEQGVDLVQFEKGQRKDDLALEYLSRFDADEGVLFVGVAQEKTNLWTTRKRRNPETGALSIWCASLAALHHWAPSARQEVDWQVGQAYMGRAASGQLTTVVPQRRHGRPARRYT
jgi:hypothetical protein